jgi:Zn-dependent protease with chaperone function
MPFLLLICLMTVCLPIAWPEPPFGIGVVGSVLFTGMTTAALLLAAGIIARQALLRIESDSAERDSIAQRYGTARTVFFFATLAGFALCLVGLGWGATATRLGSVAFHGELVLVPGGELLILAPFLLVQMGSWGFFYDADRAFHRLSASSELIAQPVRFWSRRGYVLFLFRQQLVLVFTPLVLQMAPLAIGRFYPQVLEEPWLPFAALPVALAVFILFPLVLPPLLGLKPLPPGPIRDRLAANARRLHFRYAQIHLWDTHGLVANAMVAGIVPRIRSVVFTDRLLEELTDDEVDGVFGHEVGHVHHGHVVYYMLFLMLSLTLMGALEHALTPSRLIDEKAGSDYRTLYLIVPVILMGAYMFAMFGFISRRCERQADIFGCRACSCADLHCRGHDWSTALAEGGRGLCPTGIAAFVRAMRRVEQINGLARAKPPWRGVGVLGKLGWIFRLLTGWLHTWQHSTIAKRIAFLEQIAKHPEIELRFQARLWALKWLIMLGLIGSLLGLCAWQGWEVLLAV